MKLFAYRSLMTTTSCGALIGAHCAHKLALKGWPPAQTYQKMSLTEKSFEYYRHGWIVGSGAVMGAGGIFFIPALVMIHEIK